MILFSLFLPLSLFWNVCANDTSSMVVLKVTRRFPLSVRLVISAVFTRIECQLHQTLWVTDTRWIPVPELWPQGQEHGCQGWYKMSPNPWKQRLLMN